MPQIIPAEPAPVKRQKLTLNAISSPSSHFSTKIKFQPIDPIKTDLLAPPKRPLAAIRTVKNPNLLLELEFLGTGFQPFKKLEAFSDSYLEFLSIREQTEEVLPGFGFGTNLSVTLPNGVRLRTGLNFMQINERFDPAKVSLRATGTPSIGKPTQNRLQTIDLPILLGFEKQMGRMAFGISGGAFLNLSFKPSGNIFQF